MFAAAITGNIGVFFLLIFALCALGTLAGYWTRIYSCFHCRINKYYYKHRRRDGKSRSSNFELVFRSMRSDLITNCQHTLKALVQ